MQLERRAPVGRRLDDVHARAALDLLELEDDLALVVPVEDEALAGLRLAHDRAALLAVLPAEDALAARLRVELDLGREPLLEPLRLGQRLPDLVRARRGTRSRARSASTLLSLDTQPYGCI